ncbi:MAG TPA: Npt1/Npt2 family nucleotide transporter, partial [Candidatus Eisenbacteria bacterium]|nr:Npt1/Npt2 family nucleotide transporter [Candidatus Eisenbacteria bacterium]
MSHPLARRLQLGTDEWRHAVTLGGILFSITSSYTLTKTARDAMFLAHLPATELPLVYLGAGVLTLLASLVFARATRHVATWQTLAGTAGVAAVSLVVFAWAFVIGGAWVPVVFYLWVNLYGLMLTSQFWNFTNSISDPGEAKRIFGIVGGLGILGGLVGGIAAARLGTRAGLPALLVMAAVLVALTVPAVWVGVRRGAVAGSEPPPGESGRSPFRADYVRWLALAALCSVLVTGLLDYQLKVEIQQRYPTSASLARFFGLFYTVTNTVALVFQLVGTRWSLERLGAGWSAAVLPAGLGAGALATLTSPGIGAVVGTRLWDQVMRLSLNRSAVELFYFPLEPGLRRRAKAMIDAGLERIGDALSGVLILVLGVTIGAGTWSVALVVTALVIIWLAAWFRIRRGYVDELGRNLRRMNLDPAAEPLPLREAAVRGATTRLLASPWERVVLHGMEVLADADLRALRQQLPRLLSHPSPEVRARALALAAAHWPERAEAHLAAQLADPDPRVRLAALAVRAELDPSIGLEAFAPYLDAPDPRVRAEALRAA